MKLKDKNVYVTGGSRGIGAAIVRKLAEQGARVAFSYRNSDDRAKAIQESLSSVGGGAFGIKADVADPSEAKAAVDKAAVLLGGLDIVVNNAAIFVDGLLPEMSATEIDTLLATNIGGAVFTARAAIPHLPRGGRIINIGSCLVERVPFEGVAVYAMTKSALIGFTKGLARDLGHRDICVTLVHPGPTDTDQNPANSAHAEGQRQRVALGRYGQPAQVASLVAFLAGPDGDHITGAAFAVDGGTNA